MSPMVHLGHPFRLGTWWQKKDLGVFDQFTVAVDERSITMFKVVSEKSSVPLQTS